MKILLSAEGIFPITKDKYGKPIKVLPKTGMNLSGTIQGEGKLSGVPSLFIRLSGCNLRCVWDMKNGKQSMCDTPHAAFDTINSTMWNISDIVATVKNNLGNIRHIVITGGEPMRQSKTLTTLCRHLKNELNIHITLETNGTLFDKELAEWIDLFSISPKLSNTNPTPEKLSNYNLSDSDIFKSHNKKRININGLQAYIDFCNTHNKPLQFKFVVNKRDEDKEIKSDFLNKLTGWKSDDILIMPLGATKEELNIFTPIALEIAISNGWRFSPRMHIELFKESIGV